METKTLAEKIASASIQVGAFAADKTNTEQKYSYISADAVLSRGGDALAKNGVAVIPEIDDVTIAAVERGSGRNPRLDATVQLVIQVTDGKETYTVKWFGLGTDYSTPDKAVYKAVTSGHKYFLMKLLNIGVGNEDGEHENEEQEPAKKLSKPAPQPTYPPEAGDVDREENEPTLEVIAMRLVELKVVENAFHARGALKSLECDGLSEEDAIKRVRIYRAWRDHDPKMSKEDCKAKAIAGELPQ